MGNFIVMQTKMSLAVGRIFSRLTVRAFREPMMFSQKVPGFLRTSVPLRPVMRRSPTVKYVAPHHGRNVYHCAGWCGLFFSLSAVCEGKGQAQKLTEEVKESPQ